MLVKIAIFILLSVASNAFLKNCQSFNPNSQNQCIACRKTYYLSNGSCVICPTGQTNIRQCIDIANSGKNLQADTINLPQSQAVTPSENKAESILSSLFLPSKTSATATITPTITSNISTETKSLESRTPEQKSNTQPSPQLTPPQASSSQKKDQAPDLNSLIFSFLPFKCVQFKVVPTIFCSACEKGYQLTSNNLCQEVKVENTTKSLENLTVTLVQANPPLAPLATRSSPASQSSSSSSPQAPISTSIQVPIIVPQQKSDSSPDFSRDSTAKSPNTTPVSSTAQPTSPSPSNTTPVKTITQAQIPIISTSSTSQQDKDTPSVFIPIIPIVSTKPKETNSPIPQAKVTITQSAQNSSQDKIVGILPKNQQIYDSNCVRTNPYFSLLKFISTQNQRCILCYNGFFYDLQKQLCQPFNPLCKTVDLQNICLSCYLGYDLINGKCSISQGQYIVSKTIGNTPTNPQTDPNCKQYKTGSSDCIECSNRYYYDPSKRLCVQVDGSCKSWNETNGYCVTCYSGYLCGATDRACKPIQSIAADKSNPYDPTTLKQFCLRFVNSNCISCVTRSVLMSGVCMPVSDLCMTFDRRFGFCLSCYPGYELNEGVCETPVLNPDPNCGRRTKNGCQYCIQNYFLNSSGVCEVVSSLCMGYDQSNGHCLDCLPFYTLQQQTGQCIYVV